MVFCGKLQVSVSDFLLCVNQVSDNMENIQRERCEDGPLGVPIFQRHLSSTQSLKVPSHSSFDNICDETFPYMSGIFEDTMDPSPSSDVPGATTDLPDLLHLKPLTKSQALVSSGLRSQTKLADSIWINAPVPVDISISAASPHNDTKDAASMNEPNIMEGTSDSSSCVSESAGQSEKNDIRGGSKNSTFDVTQGFKESSGSDSTASLLCVRTESNIMFDNPQELKELSADGLSSSVSPHNASLATGQEKQINSTVHIHAPSNTTIEQPNEKLDRSVGVSQLPSNVPRQDQCNDGLHSGEDFVNNNTFTQTSEPSPANQQPVDRTVTIYNTTTDLKSAGPLSNLNSAGVNAADNVMADTELQGQSDASAAVDDAPLARPSPQPHISTVSVTINPEGAVCSGRSLDDLDAEGKGEECEGLPKRRTGISEQECQLNPDISYSSLFSLDDTLDMKSQALVTSTPIVLGKDLNFLKKDFASSTKPKACSQPENYPAKFTSSASTSVSTVVNKPASKIVVRRKIPQLSCQSNIPKTQIPQRPPTSQPTSMEKSKTVSAMQASNQPEKSTYALRNMKRPVQLKGKNLAPAKNSLTAGLVQVGII